MEKIKCQWLVCSNYNVLFTLVLALLSFSAKADWPQQVKQVEGEKRVLVVITPYATHPLYSRQMKDIYQNASGISERDLTVWQVIGKDQVLNEGEAVQSENNPEQLVEQFRKSFNVKGSAYTVVLIGKDGTEKLRQRYPLSTQKLFEKIDAMPMRQAEMAQD
ncbi:DUF4174 domain-containing protein [Echinimonas agarilytica]|uniref:DUF4174 domain-containing protein n=1 Tax=Echinimonas agarilytica TaxID=1215918 RepID=A0AA41W6F1_9GAMM|nr:DUF4174 domain-containing protein [Echinimonas agarilytica]MCM2679920.1 DUF4174 domain-containing protein [Echinimonas agarilytica]